MMEAMAKKNSKKIEVSGQIWDIQADWIGIVDDEYGGEFVEWREDFVVNL